MAAIQRPLAVSIISAVIASCVLTLAEAADPFCKPLDKSTFPPFETPEFNHTNRYTQYQVKLEANFKSKGYSLDIEEWFDGDNNRAALRIWREGTIKTVIFKPDLGVVYSVNHPYNDPECIVEDIKTSDATNFVPVEEKDGRYHLKPVYDALDFDPKWGQQFKGTTYIRGQLCNHWYSCQKTDSGTVYSVDYYFSSTNWTDVLDMKNGNPVRMQVQGTSKRSGYFDHYYEFTYFRPGILPADMKMFEVPANVICKDETNFKIFDPLPNAFYYRSEMVYGDNDVVMNQDIWYDFDTKLMRIDYRTTGNPLREIHDFTTGVAYRKDLLMGNCSITAIPRGGFDEQDMTSSLDQERIEAMKTPNQIFQMKDTKFFHRGQTNIRGIKTDVYVAERSDITFVNSKIGNGKNNSVVISLYMVSDEWALIPNKGSSITQDGTVPIRMELFAQDHGMSQQVLFSASYNFFDFSTSRPPLSTYDIDDCFPSQAKFKIQLTIPGQYTGIVQYQVPDFIFAAELEASSVMDLSPMRVQGMKLDYSIDSADHQTIYLTFDLLERVPWTALYTLVATNQTRVGQDKIFTQVTDIDQCGNACEDEDTFACNSFDYCPGEGGCYLSKTHTGQQSKYYKFNCIHGQRNIDNPGSPHKASDSLLVLRNNVAMKLFGIPVKITATKTISYIATEFKQMDPSKGGYNYLADYTRVENKIIYTTDLVDSTVSIDECAELCAKKSTDVCMAFNYCYSLGSCMLSPRHPDLYPKTVATHSGCDMFKRSFLSRFVKAPGKSVLLNDFHVNKQVKSAAQCANECIIGDRCRSFDFCQMGTATSCLLSHKHGYDIPKTDIIAQPSCDHYSRYYVDDFSSNKSVNVSLEDAWVTDNIGLELCSKLCIDQLGNRCASFDFCTQATPNGRCVLKDRTLKGNGAPTKELSAVCDHYTRVYAENGSKYDPTTALAVVVTQDTGYSPGAMAGLGVAMVILGAVLGFFLIVSFSKLRPVGSGSGTTELRVIQNPGLS